MFRNLPLSEQKAMIAHLLKMRKWRKGLVDIAIAETRNREKSRPFRDFLKDKDL